MPAIPLAVAPLPSPLRERKLAAIVVTDVAGHAAMVQSGEATVLARAAADLEALRTHAKSRGGEILSTRGGGLVLAFDGPVTAVEFAMAVQRQFASRNESLGERWRVRHRIGIHVGDVDGVDIAARIEPSAPAGGVCASQPVRDLVRGKANFDARFAGARAFKDFTDPLVVWLWHPDAPLATGAPPMPRPRAERRKALETGLAGALVVAWAFVVMRDGTGS